MRIIAGKAKGRKLRIPYEQGARPFLEQARGAIFNIISKKIVGAKILDIYAGSGALGLEGLSRGAATASFIERDPTSVAILNENISKCDFKKESSIIQQDAVCALENIQESFDLIFLDPPFADSADWKNFKASDKIIKNTVKIAAENGTIIFRLEKEKMFPEAWDAFNLIDQRIYGRSRICFYGNNK